MFANLQSEVDARFTAVESYFRATKTFKGDLANAAKGLAFVQMYAVYEFTVCSAVEAAIDSINSQKHKMRDITPSLLTLFLDADLKSLRDGGASQVWDRRIIAFERAFSNELANIPTTTNPPTDGSHYRHTHLQIIFRVFGINRLPARRQTHLLRIDEVVDSRNAIAHGRETPEDIGRRHTRADIQHAILQMKSVCTLLISVFQNHCATPSKHRR